MKNSFVWSQLAKRLCLDIKSLFGLTSYERMSYLFFAGLLALVCFYSDQSKHQKTLDRVILGELDVNTPKSFLIIPQDTLPLFSFDLNRISTDGLVELGFSIKQAASIIKYREKAGGFESKIQFEKLYVVSDKMYKRLCPYIKISAKSNSSKKQSFSKPSRIKTKERNIDVFSINEASPDDLQRINGVGEVYSKRIVAYRELLGGYVRKEQLFDVYGLDSCLARKIGLCVKFQLNAVTRNVLTREAILAKRKHPYLRGKTAKLIKEYLNVTKKDSLYVDELKKNKILPESKCYELLDYFY